VETVNLKSLALELVFFEVCKAGQIGSPFEILKSTVEDFCGEDP
jgi:hypothetical protein